MGKGDLCIFGVTLGPRTLLSPISLSEELLLQLILRPQAFP